MRACVRALNQATPRQWGAKEPAMMEGEREDLTGSIQSDGERLDPVRVGVW